jgi:hypothetical protein
MKMFFASPSSRIHIAAVVLVLLTTLMLLTMTAQAGTCSLAPQRVGYTFERGTGGGRIPGHAFVGWNNPLRSGSWITGGSYQYWKSENGQSLFLVSSWPWDYRLNWQCSGGGGSW